MKIRNLLYTFLAVSSLVSRPVTGDEIQSRESIREIAESYIKEAVESGYGSLPTVTAGQLDSRLRLTECEKPLDAFQPNGGRLLGNTTVGIRCSGSQPWTLYVPVTVSIYEPVAVAARALSRGKIIEREDLKLINRDLAKLGSGYYIDLTQVIGKEVARTISMGAAITTHQIKDQRQIRRGQQISLLAEASGLKVLMSGEALADGTTGELIKVRNLSTRRIINGTVLSATTVRVNM